MKKKVVLVGAGGHCKVVIDILKKQEDIKLIGLIDKDKTNLEQKICGVPIIGSDNELAGIKTKVDATLVAVGSIGDNSLRYKLYNRLNTLNYNFINAIHYSSIIGENVNLKKGNTIMAGAIINPGVQIGVNNIVNTGAVVDHDAQISNHTHLAPGVKISGGVKIGGCSHLGTGAVVIQGIEIGKNCLIGAGAVIIEDVPDNSVVVGNPGRIIRKRG